ncbi:MAG TPA: cupin domain-containing protein [Candidatus Acidoferrum sp.]|nr:cupin domain-containing protein [Candidatus Acidoferrum sp.]
MNELQGESRSKNKAGGSTKPCNGIWHSRRWIGILVALFAAITVSAQAPKTGFTRTLAEVKFPKDDKPDCLQFAIENGDLKTGPSTAIMKAAPNCVVPPHYHTAEEQLIIVRGEVSTGMDGMQDTLLGPGGFAMMASKQVHWFSCTVKEECLIFVTFDRAYDIVWVKDQK